MMRIQYNSFIQRLFDLINEEYEIETNEGKEVFEALGHALFQVYLSRRQK